MDQGNGHEKPAEERDVTLSVKLKLINGDGGLLVDGYVDAGELEDQPVVVAGIAITHAMKLFQAQIEAMMLSGAMSEQDVTVLTAYAMAPLAVEFPEEEPASEEQGHERGQTEPY